MPMSEAKTSHRERHYPLTLVPLPMGEGTGWTARNDRMRIAAVLLPQQREGST
jgi:hypothetical protein